MNAAKCPSCGVDLPPSEVASGWCEACGKKVPAYITAGPTREERAAERSPGDARGKSPSRLPTFAYALVALLVLALVGLRVKQWLDARAAANKAANTVTDFSAFVGHDVSLTYSGQA